MALSNNIRKLRFKHGEMTQKELAKSVGVSRQTVNTIENNKHAPTIDVAFRIADVFGESVEVVFGRKSCTVSESELPDELTVVVSWDDDDVG